MATVTMPVDSNLTFRLQPTAKVTAKLADLSGPAHTIVDSPGLRPNFDERYWTVLDGGPAVFKTVCGALLRRPGWVRFPSIPANLRGCESLTDDKVVVNA
jgi:hypothetical protein